MSKRSVKLICTLIVAVLAFGIILSGCGKDTNTKSQGDKTQGDSQTNNDNSSKNNTKKPTIRFAYNWSGSDAKAQYFEPALEKYKEENKDKVEIQLEPAPGNELETKIKVDVAGGNIPDIFMYWGGAFLKPLVEGKVLINIDDYLNASQKIKKEQFNADSWAPLRDGDVTYGVPVEVFKGFFLVNKNLFEKYNLEYPKNYEDMEKVTKVFKENGIIPISATSKAGNPGHMLFSALVGQMENGKEDMLSIAETSKFDTDSAILAAQLVEDMRKAGMLPEDTVANGDWGPNLALYNAEKAAMIYTFPWMIGAVQPEIAEVSEVVALPQMRDGVVDPATFTIGSTSMGVVISKEAFEDADKKQALIEFADYLLSDEMFGELAKASMMPAKNVQIDPAIIDPLFNRILDFTGNQEVYTPYVDFLPNQNVQNVYMNSLDELFAGAITGKEFVDKVQKAIDK